MSEQKSKPTLKEFVSEYLSGNVLELILCFNDFLNDNGLKAKRGAGASKNFYVVYKGKKICDFGITGKDLWVISIANYKKLFLTETFEKYITNEQRKFLLDTLRTVLPCTFSYGSCTYQGGMEFLGVNYENICGCYPHYQDVNDLLQNINHFNCMKELIIIYKKILDDIAEAKKRTK